MHHQRLEPCIKKNHFQVIARGRVSIKNGIHFFFENDQDKNNPCQQDDDKRAYDMHKDGHNIFSLFLL
jgi:hypothetical protein